MNPRGRAALARRARPLSPQRTQWALACGDPARPDARAMFLADGDLANAQAREARVHRKARESMKRDMYREAAEATRIAQERNLELLKDQQAEALARGELTPEKAAEFREARASITAAPSQPPRRRQLLDLLDEPISVRGGAGMRARAPEVGQGQSV